jgi:hypothetical protein
MMTVVIVDECGNVTNRPEVLPTRLASGERVVITDIFVGNSTINLFLINRPQVGYVIIDNSGHVSTVKVVASDIDEAIAMYQLCLSILRKQSILLV